ncbi:MAG: NAD(P)H-hydrate dehydratase [Betaproteobacteria bacterium]|nr:NAD(P)H-hydrate dehydratase [Betaproteobacteria bacterium]
MPALVTYNSPIYRTGEIREIEAAAAALPLMERAGLAAAELARKIAPDLGKPVLVVAGPGNNGGDAFVIARHLRQWWFNVTVVFAGDETKLSGDAAAALKAWREAGGIAVAEIPSAGDWSLVIDGLFGIGLQREVAGRHAEIVAALNGMRAPRLAVDIPSGLESDTGRVMGCAVRADHTITFIALKPGLLTLDGLDHCGTLHVAPLDIDAPAIKAPRGTVIGIDILTETLPSRRRNTHKGDYGSVGIIGGAHGMVGAALLAGRAALKLGAGRVYVGSIERDAPPVDMTQPELMLRTADEVLKVEHLTALAIGPGLGQAPDAAFCLRWAIESRLPLVIDADGLNLIAASGSLRDALPGRRAPTVLTPHPAEAARLLGCGTHDVQFDRVAAAVRLSHALAADVVLKGAGSICASPDGTWGINTSGNPGMASAGMGDVLTGFLAALLAQGADAKTALRAAVHLHSAAADALVADGAGPVGLTAAEVIDSARRLFNHPR